MQLWWLDSSCKSVWLFYIYIHMFEWSNFRGSSNFPVFQYYGNTGYLPNITFTFDRSHNIAARLIVLKTNQQVLLNRCTRLPRTANKWVPEPFGCTSSQIGNESIRGSMLSNNSPVGVLMFLGFATKIINVLACWDQVLRPRNTCTSRLTPHLASPYTW